VRIQPHPQDVQIERAFLSLVRFRKAFDIIRGTISDSYFSSTERKKAFTAISKAFEADIFLERVTAANLSGKVDPEEIAAISVDPMEVDKDVSSLGTYLADRFARRSAAEAAMAYYECEDSYESMLSKIENVESDATATKPTPLETGDQWMADGAKRFASIGRISTGFDYLNSVLQWAPGNVYILAADTGAGKTLMAHELAFGYSIANQAYSGIIGLELSRDEVAFRWVKSRTVEDASWIHHPDRTNWTPTSAVREITNRVRQGVRFWVVDHFMLFAKEDPRQNQTEFEAQTARQLERCAKATGATILVVGQYSKAGAVAAGMKPSMHNLKGAKALEDIAAGVMIIDHDEDPSCMSALFVDKNRFGKGKVNVGCRFRWDDMRVDFCRYEEMNRTASQPKISRKAKL